MFPNINLLFDVISFLLIATFSLSLQLIQRLAIGYFPCNMLVIIKHILVITIFIWDILIIT